MKNILKLVFLICLIAFVGCSFIEETGRVIWGNSIKAMEEARVNAISRTYQGNFDDCFEAVLNLARNKSDVFVESEEDDDEDVEFGDEEEYSPEEVGTFDVFAKNPVKGYIVVMGIKGNIETTEVGIFFTEVGRRTIKIEVSSASTTAKDKVASYVFKELGLQFTETSL